MREPAFWWREAGAAAGALSPFAAIYGAVAKRRMLRPGRRVGVPIVCIGNPTVGGAGKTPLALTVARMLAAAGEQPALLSRGYGGSLSGPVQVDPARHRAADVGDEPLLLARAAPTIVSRDRPAGAGLAAQAGADVILMDDGLQNPSLKKDVAFAVFDAGVGIGNGFCLPAGPLRAPMRAQWPKIDAVVLVGQGPPGDAIAREADARGLPLFPAALIPDPEVARSLQGARVLAFAGIGRPGKFFDTLSAFGATLLGTEAFPDHHAYSPADIRRLLDRAERDRMQLVTTEKDFVRLAALGGAEPRLGAILTLPVRLTFADEGALGAFLAERLGRS
jgi:tetraacyldisaccharide 4'-kinase